MEVLGAGRGCGYLREPRALCDTRATARREQRLTGLAVFILTGVSVFMAPVLKVRKAAAGFDLQGFFASFLKSARSACSQQGRGHGLVVSKPDTPPAAAVPIEGIAQGMPGPGAISQSSVLAPQAPIPGQNLPLLCQPPCHLLILSPKTHLQVAWCLSSSI